MWVHTDIKKKKKHLPCTLPTCKSHPAAAFCSMPPTSLNSSFLGLAPETGSALIQGSSWQPNKIVFIQLHQASLLLSISLLLVSGSPWASCSSHSFEIHSLLWWGNVSWRPFTFFAHLLPLTIQGWSLLSPWGSFSDPKGLLATTHVGLKQEAGKDRGKK